MIHAILVTYPVVGSPLRATTASAQYLFVGRQRNAPTVSNRHGRHGHYVASFYTPLSCVLKTSYPSTVKAFLRRRRWRLDYRVWYSYGLAVFIKLDAFPAVHPPLMEEDSLVFYDHSTFGRKWSESPSSFCFLQRRIQMHLYLYIIFLNCIMKLKHDW